MRSQTGIRGLRLALCTIVGLATSARSDDLTAARPPGDGPTRIAVSLYVIDLMEISDTSQAFEADLFFVARWKDQRLAGGPARTAAVDEVWMPNLLVFNQRDASRDLPEEVEVAPDGTVTYRQRLTGTFASPFNLSRFPMDMQTLEIRVISYTASAEEVVLVESTDVPISRSSELSVSDWEIGPLRVDTSVFEPLPGVAFSSLTVRLPARRLIGYFIVQLFVPLVLIVGMSWSVFWIGPSVVASRMAISVTSVLTLIAFRFMVGGFIPKLPYLTRVDYLLLGATTLVAASLMTATLGAYLLNVDRAATVPRVDRVARVAFPLGFLVLLVSLPLFGS